MIASRTAIDRRFYLLFSPLAWAGCSLLHFQYPGDEYAMYFISSVAGSWIFSIFQAGDIHNPLIPLSVAATGAVVIAAAGWLLVRLRVRKALWAGLFAASALVILWLMLHSFPNLERALRKNGSWWAYVCSAVQLGMYTATVLSAAVVGITRLCRRANVPARTGKI